MLWQSNSWAKNAVREESWFYGVGSTHWFSMSRKSGRVFKVLKPWTHKHKKTFSRKLFNNILLSARPTKRLINTAFRTKLVRKTVIWKNRKKGNSASEWFLKNSRNVIFCCSPEIRFSLWKMELLPLTHPFSNPNLGKEYLRFVCLFATSTFINPVFLTPSHSTSLPWISPQPISAAFALCFLLHNAFIPYLRSHSCFHGCTTAFPLHSLQCGMMFWAHCCSLLLEEMSTKWDIVSRQEIRKARTLHDKAGRTQNGPHAQLQVQLHIWWEIRAAEKCLGKADKHSHSTASRFVVKFSSIHRLKNTPVNPHHKRDDSAIPCQLSCSKLINDMVR